MAKTAWWARFHSDHTDGPYDCLPHELMVAKLEAYGLAKESIHLISDYLSHR